MKLEFRFLMFLTDTHIFLFARTCTPVWPQITEVGSHFIGSAEISRKQGSGEIYASHNLQISSSNCSSASYLSLGRDAVV